MEYALSFLGGIVVMGVYRQLFPVPFYQKAAAEAAVMVLVEDLQKGHSPEEQAERDDALKKCINWYIKVYANFCEVMR